MNKRIAAVALGLVFLVIFLTWLVHFLSYGQLVVTTNDRLSTISVSLPLTNKSSAQQTIAKGNGSLKVSLRSGQYVISALGQYGLSGSSKLIHIGAHKTSRFKLELTNIGQVEPVVATNIQDLSVSSDQISYLDPDDSQLNSISDSNQITALAPANSFSSVAWADPTYGVAENSSNQLYIINGSTVSQANVPAGAVSFYSIATDKTLYTDIYGVVYRSLPGGQPKTIYRGAATSLEAAVGQVAIINSGYGGSPSVKVIRQGPKVVTRTFSQALNLWSNWSPAAKNIALLVGSQLDIYNRQLDLIATVPGINPGSLGWQSDNTLLYSVADQLWSFNLSTNSAQLVATMPLDQTIQAITIDNQSDYVYLTAESVDGIDNIDRLGLRDQSVPNFLSELSVIMPLTLTNSSLSLVNFVSPPTIDVSPNPGTDPSSDLQSAQTELQGRGFNISQINFSLLPGGD